MDDLAKAESASSPTGGSATIEIAAPAADVFAILVDLDRLPTLSPENVRCDNLERACETTLANLKILAEG